MSGNPIGGASNAGWKDWIVPAPSAVVKASPGVLWSMFGTWTKDDPRYLLFFDSATVPVEGTVPFFSALAMPGNSSITVQFPRGRRFYTNGIAWAVSNTAGVLSYDSTALLSLSVEYA